MKDQEDCEIPFQPLDAKVALGQMPILKSPRILGDFVLWLEQRPNEGGRITACIRPWFSSDCFPQELSPAPMNLRSRVHDYGGGVIAAEIEGDVLWLVFIDDCHNCLWQQLFEIQPLKKLKASNSSFCKPLEPIICLAEFGEYKLADGYLDMKRRRWVGVMESDHKDFLVSFTLNKEKQIPQIIYSPNSFVGYATQSPDSSQMAWVEWQETDMPWDASQLWHGSLNDSGQIIHKKLLAGNAVNPEKKTSVFQPIWLPTGELVVSNDQSGWWNLMITCPDNDASPELQWLSPWPQKAETAMPQWVYGMSTASASGKNVLSASCSEGSWEMKLLNMNGLMHTINQPFDDLADIHADKERAVAIASNSCVVSGLLEIDLKSGHWTHSSMNNSFLDEFPISIPESFWFKGFQGKRVHSWYYPPTNKIRFKNTVPLLVKSHSGPTAMASKGLNLGIQFWTSRGWGVVDVNYSGSTGFGREYRERLKFGWGQVDVFDCAAAAKALIHEGISNKELIAIEGGSAGGFTTLACLCFTDIFRVGACRYAVTDLEAMAKETHRFEKHYLDYLVGSLLEEPKKFHDRSPLNNANKIECPVIFFQGLQDQVVLPSQTEKMVRALKKNNIPVEVYTFKNEGHGFKDMTVKIKVLEATEKFFNKHLNL